MIALVAILLGQKTPAFTSEWEWQSNVGSPLSVVSDEKRKFLYVAQNEGGLAILRISKLQSEARLAARIPKSKFEYLDATTVMLIGGDAYVALGNFFQPHSKYGLARIDVSNPLQPVIKRLWISDYSAHGSSGLAVYGNTLAMGLMQDGVAFFDLSDPVKIKFIKSLGLNQNFPNLAPREPSVPHARGLAFASENLLIADDAGGLRAVNCSDLNAPKEIGRYIQSDMGEKQQAYNNVVVDEQTAFVAVDYAGVEAIDISDPKKMKPIGWWNPWNADKPENLWLNSPGHINQLALDASTHTLYVSAGASQLIALDVTEPTAMKEKSRFGSATENRGTWGLNLNSRSIYLSYVRAIIPFKSNWSGIKALRAH